MAPAAPILPEPAVNGFPATAEPGAPAEEARVEGALVPSSETNFDKVEKADKFADFQQNGKIVDEESNPEAIIDQEE